jgi:thioredoxin domain-containing protein 5
LSPVWDELAKTLEHDSSVSISKIDCTQFRPICQDFEVKGYPTLLWIEDGKKLEKYSGARSIDDFKVFVEKMSGVKAAAPKDTDDTAEKKVSDGDNSIVVELTGTSFDHGIEKGVSFVKFYAPWCGHCKR